MVGHSRLPDQGVLLGLVVVVQCCDAYWSISAQFRRRYLTVGEKWIVASTYYVGLPKNLPFLLSLFEGIGSLIANHKERVAYLRV